MNGLMVKATLPIKSLLLSALLALMVIVCYWPVQEHGFVNYDDPLYVTENQQVQAGLTWEGFLWAFRDMQSTNWHPLTWLSHMTDWQLFRDQAAGHHWNNVLFHVINTLLLFSLLKGMTGALWQSACVAAIFALHPLNVESVAWIAERKNLLSTGFGLLSLLFYRRYLLRTSWVWYLPVMLAFSMSLMAKPMLVTLPFVMLLLDYWPLNRYPLVLEADGGGRAEGPFPRQAPCYPDMGHHLLRLIIEKIPLFMLSGFSMIVTIVAADRGGAIKSLAHFPLAGRLANVLHAYAGYLVKYVWPDNLSVFYPNRPGDFLWQTVPALFLLASVTFVVLHQVRRRPYLAVGWFWFLGTLVPVIGLVQVGLQGMADRYTYVPCIGLSIMLAWGLSDLRGSMRYPFIPVLVLSVLLLAAGFGSRSQIRIWENSQTLFSHAVKVTEHNEIAHNNLANALFQQGDTEGAVAHFREAVRINPWYMTAHNNLGILLARQGKTLEAIEAYEKTLRMNPRHKGALFNMGLALESQNRLDDADRYYAEVLLVDPGHAQAHRQLGVTAVKRGRYGQAIIHFEAALTLRPGDPDLAAAIEEAGKRRAMQKELDHSSR